jgi:hypothetical protein
MLLSTEGLKQMTAMERWFVWLAKMEAEKAKTA